MRHAAMASAPAPSAVCAQLECCGGSVLAVIEALSCH